MNLESMKKISKAIDQGEEKLKEDVGKITEIPTQEKKDTNDQIVKITAFLFIMQIPRQIQQHLWLQNVRETIHPIFYLEMENRYQYLFNSKLEIDCKLLVMLKV